jgi:hypothetical protein
MKVQVKELKKDDVIGLESASRGMVVKSIETYIPVRDSKIDTIINFVPTGFIKINSEEYVEILNIKEL